MSGSAGIHDRHDDIHDGEQRLGSSLPGPNPNL
jgi:hypothetical protein